MQILGDIPPPLHFLLSRLPTSFPTLFYHSPAYSFYIKSLIGKPQYPFPAALSIGIAIGLFRARSINEILVLVAQVATLGSWVSDGEKERWMIVLEKLLEEARTLRAMAESVLAGWARGIVGVEVIRWGSVVAEVKSLEIELRSVEEKILALLEAGTDSWGVEVVKARRLKVFICSVRTFRDLRPSSLNVAIITFVVNADFNHAGTFRFYYLSQEST